jgi:hypothetical protein
MDLVSKGLLLASILVLLLASASCNLPSRGAAPIAPALSTATPSASVVPSLAPTQVPSELVWLAPNFGSKDYTALFSMPENWSIARAKINVFKFYLDNVLDNPCQICGDNTLQAFVRVDAFRKLSQWGVATAIEVGAVKEWDCTGDEEFHNADVAIQNVQQNGGKVDLLAMDEPLIGGQLVVNGRTCQLTPEQTAAATAHFVELVRASYPDLIVGDIEPYPYFSIDQLEAWIAALEQRGAAPAFFHLDVDLERVRVENQDVSAALQTLRHFCAQQGIPFGVIFTSNWTAAGSNSAYFDSTMEWIRTVKAAIGTPQQMIFQSWQGPAPSGAHEIPVNLPQNDPDNYSQVRLINEGLAVFGR